MLKHQTTHWILRKKQTLCNNVLFLPQLVLLSRYHKMYVFGKQNGFCSQNFFRKKNNFFVLCISTSALRNREVLWLVFRFTWFIWYFCLAWGPVGAWHPPPLANSSLTCVCQSGIKTIVICLYISWMELRGKNVSEYKEHPIYVCVCVTTNWWGAIELVPDASTASCIQRRC